MEITNDPMLLIGVEKKYPLTLIQQMIDDYRKLALATLLRGKADERKREATLRSLGVSYAERREKDQTALFDKYIKEYSRQWKALPYIEWLDDGVYANMKRLGFSEAVHFEIRLGTVYK